MIKGNWKKLVLAFVLVAWLVLVGYSVGRDVYVDLKYTDDCEWYGYNEVRWTWDDGTMCEKHTPLSKLDELRDEWDSRAK